MKGLDRALELVEDGKLDYVALYSPIATAFVSGKTFYDVAEQAGVDAKDAFVFVALNGLLAAPGAPNDEKLIGVFAGGQAFKVAPHDLMTRLADIGSENVQKIVKVAEDHGGSMTIGVKADHQISSLGEIDEELKYVAVVSDGGIAAAGINDSLPSLSVANEGITNNEHIAITAVAFASYMTAKGNKIKILLLGDKIYDVDDITKVIDSMGERAKEVVSVATLAGLITGSAGDSFKGALGKLLEGMCEDADHGDETSESGWKVISG